MKFVGWIGRKSGSEFVSIGLKAAGIAALALGLFRLYADINFQTMFGRKLTWDYAPLATVVVLDTIIMATGAIALGKILDCVLEMSRAASGITGGKSRP